MCAGGRLSGSQPPARVLKSHLWNWFHGPFGRAQRRPVPKKMPAARSAHDADSEPGAAAIASRLSQLKKSRAPYLGGGGPGKVRRSLISRGNGPDRPPAVTLGGQLTGAPNRAGSIKKRDCDD